MVPQESQAAQQPVFDYLVATVRKENQVLLQILQLRESQFNQPLLEFSGSVQDVQRHLTLV